MVILVFLTVSILFVAFLYFPRTKKSFHTDSLSLATEETTGVDDITATTTISMKEQTGTNQGSSVSNIAKDEFTESYRDAKNGFEFRYPKRFTLSVFEEGGGTMILLQNPVPNLDIQIYVSAFTGTDRTLTAERLKEEIPDLVVESPQEVIVTASNKGIAFMSESESIKTREVWFIVGSGLYQISNHFDANPIVQKLLETWQFNK